MLSFGKPMSKRSTLEREGPSELRTVRARHLTPGGMALGGRAEREDSLVGETEMADRYQKSRRMMVR